MFKFVDSKIIKPYKSFCSAKVNQLKNIMHKKYSFDCDFCLIGSGDKNLVTQNENEPFDLDYNFIIKRFPNDFILNNSSNLKWLKDTIRNELNTILKESKFKDVQDSTSVLTARLFIKNVPDKKQFSFDVAILARDKDGCFCKLIHDKTSQGRFFWNKIPYSDAIFEKANELKKNGHWNDIRKNYLALKNIYLKRGDCTHPSFIVYVEAINQAYNKVIKDDYWICPYCGAKNSTEFSICQTCLDDDD